MAAAVATTAAAALFAPAAAWAGAVTDGSMGAVQTLTGTFSVPQTLGTVRGANLFHSFSRFGVAPGESATFTTTDAGIGRVISRVTGGEASLIQGLLRLQAAGGSQPAFYFINPSGITIGAGGVVDVPGALHLSTAPLLNFADGFVFDARSNAPSTLTVAAPESFGFVDGANAAAAAAPLRLQEALVQLQPGAGVELAGGAVTLDRTLLFTQDAPIRIEAGSLTAIGGGGLDAGLFSAPGLGAAAAIDLRVAGDLTLGAASVVFSGASVGGSGPVRIQAGGTVRLRDGATVFAAHGGLTVPGEVSVEAGTLVVEGSGTSIASTNFGTAPTAAAVRIVARERVDVRGGAQVGSLTLGGGGAGAVDVSAPVITLTGAPGEVTGISSGSLAALSGDAGAVTVQAGTLTTAAGAQISSVTASNLGNAGNVTVRVTSLAGDGMGVDTPIFSSARSVLGNAGAVRVLATGDITLREGASIFAGADGFGSSGSVEVTAASLLAHGRGSSTVCTGICGGALGAASAPPVSVLATGGVELREGAVISSLTATGADAGTIRITADSIVIDGNNGGAPTGISSDSVSAGSAGLVDLRARQIRVANGAAVSSSTLDSGRGGSIRIDAASTFTADAGLVSAAAFATGDAGSIEITAGSARLTNRGLVTTSTQGAGRGGTIGLNAQTLVIDGAAGILSLALGAGDAGRIDLTVAGAMTLGSGGKITANTAGAGAAGQVRLTAGTLLVTGVDEDGFPSGIASRALLGSGGQPGNVSIDVAGLFELREGGIVNIANEALVANPAVLAPATIALRAGDIVLDNAAITAAASANANAGRIDLVTPGRLRLASAAVTTSALDGDGGPITISAGRFVRLTDSGITTSVTGTTNGNGGDITLRAGALALDSGFIQANTRAPLARGGQVTVDVGLLVPSGSNVFIGGNRITAFRSGLAGFNVVQAAAPDGVGGQLDVTIPELNLAGSLVSLTAAAIDFGPLARDWCEPGAAATVATVALGAGGVPVLGESGQQQRRQSSLQLLGRGGTRAPAAGPLGIVP